MNTLQEERDPGLRTPHADTNQANITSIGVLIGSRLAYMKKKAVMTRPIVRVNTDKVEYIATAIGLAA
ncbi:hypothetical protein DY000_02037047 [Brassica cretica]|uniref:Uncharacterized protein n=1 Tax=Brassica cretica TaxID=69181 RepID=A0ABQ7BD04_BRACR|nr:hypothetical protein DY000_02037047 [Brassica cretica]